MERANKLSENAGGSVVTGCYWQILQKRRHWLRVAQSMPSVVYGFSGALSVCRGEFFEESFVVFGEEAEVFYLIF